MTVVIDGMSLKTGRTKERDMRGGDSPSLGSNIYMMILSALARIINTANELLAQ